MDDYGAIANLVNTYAERVDAGDFDGVGELFADAEFVFGSYGETRRGREDIKATFESLGRIYDDGTPKTKHVTTNLIVEVDGDGATGRSYFFVLQEVPVGSNQLQIIFAGRYHDRYRRVDGTWRFAARQVTRDQQGDASAHLLR